MSIDIEIDHKAYLAMMDPALRERLTARSDRAGLIHLVGHVAVILGLGALIAVHVPLWWALLLPQGVAIAFLFTLQHETTHKTPFASERLNEWVGWASGLAIVQPFLWFRYFHLAHHRFTNDPERDPELGGVPKPDDWRSLAYHLSCLGYWRDKAGLVWTNAVGPIDAPYLPTRIHRRLRREARGMLGIYGAIALFSATVSPILLWTWVLPLA
ncbi:MAG: fatty acid desaturase, partial [Pseudomonadota bacterium]